MTLNPQKHRPCYEIFIITPNPTAMMKISFQALLATRRVASAIHATVLTDQDQLEMYEYRGQEYLRQFFDREMFEHLAEQTNLYSVQKSGKSTNTDADEREQFVGIFLMTGLIPVPQYHFYWNEKLQFTPVSQTMSKNRFKQLRRYFHAADNSKILPKLDPGFDSLFKLRPFLDALQEKCLAVAPEEAQSIVYQFAAYIGADTLKESQDYQLGFGDNIVMALCDGLPNASNFKGTFDNWFCSIELIEDLKRRGIFSCGRIRANQMRNCVLESEKDFRKRGRGSFDYNVENSENVVVVRWLDNKAVQLASSYTGVEPEDQVKRWSASEKKHILVTRPAIVKTYNETMGGVDLADQLIEYYRIPTCFFKWYIKLFVHFLNLTAINSWLLYRRHAQQLQLSKQMTLFEFILDVSDALQRSLEPCEGRWRKEGSRDDEQGGGIGIFIT
ncbi:piggyBac transposable element-derived protein 3-like [Ixodes scapularis]|uniref:piggyBac transposable element-derived protein 3-like n=1 Tax=Ixodes scapularis TaxID=6945 RepID=UPI001C3852ED|nr:piggyBac transposable element-derived protein 3-like [Ixodes scapularis]